MRANCDFSEHISLVFEAWDKFKDNKKVKEYFKDPDEAFVSLLQNEFKMSPENLLYQNTVSKGRMRGFQKRLDSLVRNVEKGKLTNKMAEMFYTPSSFANTDPTISKLLNDYIHTSHTYQGTQKRNTDSQAKIKREIIKEASARGLLSNSLVEFGKKITFRTAEDKIRRNEEQMNKLAVEAKNGNQDSEAKFRDLVRKEDQLIADTEAGVYAELIGYIEGPEGVSKLVDDRLLKEDKKLYTKNRRTGEDKYLLKREDFTRLLDKDGKPISSRMANALHEYTKFTEDLYWDLKNGVDSYVETIIEGQRGKTKDQINDMRDRLYEKLMPNPQKGFYPHFRRGLNIDFMDGLMGKLEDLVLASNKHFNTEMSMQSAIDNVNGFITGHAKSRETDISPNDYSYNFNRVMSSYASNVARFNYINRINYNTKKTMTQLENLYKDGNYEGGYGESVMEFIQDLHKSATGYDQIKNPAINNMLRTILGFEFISKIGFNPRSAIRNMSQSLMNLVEWSPIQIKESNAFFKDTDRLADVNKQMESIGILFKDDAPELQESMGRTPGGFSSVRYNDQTGKLEHIPITTLEKTAGIANTIAGTAGKMTGAIENFNRKTTFKIAYAQMYKSLDNNNFYEMQKAKYLKRLKNPENASGAKIDAAVEAAKTDAAKRYAINMTVGMHFDYNAFSKSKVLRTKIGSVVGQFQHYSFKFFEKNAEVLRNAKNDVMVGDVSGNDAWKLYRLGIVYFMAPAIASAMTGIDIGNIVEHDPASKLQKLSLGFTGDPDSEEYKRAFFNKGPVMGTIGAPALSTLLNLGMMTELINMDEDSMLTLLDGYDDAYANELSSQYKKDKLYAISKLLNTGLNRIAYRHLPQLAKGNIGWVAQSELGLYPTAEAKDKQNMVKGLSPEMFKALEELEKKGR